MPPPEQGQPARRSDTRAAIITATVESLLTLGVAGTSTRGVAERAGVSQGALQHYFPTKAQLVEEALSATLTATLDELFSPPFGTRSAPERAKELLERLWRFHRLPIFAAVFEGLALAPRDAAAARRTAMTIESLVTRLETAASTVLPPEMDEQTLRTRVRLVVAAVRGAASVEDIPGDAGSDWDLIREDLVEVLLRPTL